MTNVVRDDLRWLLEESDLRAQPIGDREWIVRYVDQEGTWNGVIELHERSDGTICGGSVMFALPYGAPSVPRSEGVTPQWKVESLEPLTLSPSVLCSPELGGCGHHGFIQNGRWQGDRSPSPSTGDVLTITVDDRSYLITNPGGRVGSKLVNGEPYERQLLADIAGRNLSGVAFDIGAHVGNHSLYLAAVCGLTVYAFEPHPESFRMLQANIALNPSLDVRAVNCAAGAHDGRARFAGRMQLKTGRGHVPVRALDELVEPCDLAVVKVDVEGMEPEVLAGMTGHLSRCRPVVYTETHTRTAGQRTDAVLRDVGVGYQPTGTIVMGSTMTRWEVV